MRRRALRMIRRAGLVVPTVAALAGAAEAMSAKDHRDRETAQARARVQPAPSDATPADPVAAAFALFPEARAELREETAGNEDEALAAMPLAGAPTEIEPGVVAVERAAPPLAVGPAPVVMAYALPTDPTPIAPQRAFTPPTVSRVLKVPLPKRRPADLGEGSGAGTMRLASLTPEPPRVAVEPAAPIGAEISVLGEPKKIPKEAQPYLAVLKREAAANKVPLWLAIGVGWVESKYQPGLRGSHGVVGLMQVMPSTARFQGYKGPSEKLLDPETNIVWGMRELGWDWAKAGGNPCLAIAKYKGGIATTRISPAAADYCRRAKAVTGMI